MKKLILILSACTFATFFVYALLVHKGVHALDDEDLFEED